MAVKIKELLKEKTLGLRSLTSEALLSLKAVKTPRIQKTGLLLTGLIKELLHAERIQILGAAEIRYLNSLGERKKRETLKVFPRTVPAIVITRGLRPPKELLGFAEKEGIPVLTTHLTSSVFIERLIKFLEERLAPTTLVHGVLVDILGIGVLITGKSGIGKSECALDLISRGYRLVADDAVIVKKIYPSTLFGMASDKIPYHIEVRGIGIMNVKDIFGITAIREKKQMDMVVELVSWDPKGDYERLGLEEKTCEILGVELPHLKVPVSPGRSVATIVEVAARNQLLKIMGYPTGRELVEDLIPVSPKKPRLKKVKG